MLYPMEAVAGLSSIKKYGFLGLTVFKCCRLFRDESVEIIDFTKGWGRENFGTWAVLQGGHIHAFA